MSTSYHRGEIAVQELAGVRSQAILNGRAISSVIPPPARPFVNQQSCVAIGWVDPSGDPWASLAVGEPGFASCDEAGTVVTIRRIDGAAQHGPFFDEMAASDALGMLFIDLATRRRLRVNGISSSSTRFALRIDVDQAYANCPKYIQRRERVEATTPTPPGPISSGLGVPAHLRPWLSRTDTAFVTSVGPNGSVDCSHRGGRCGFIRMEGNAVLVPDYPGNSMFCSLGNIAVQPRAGLVLVDFDAQQQLHLSGDASLELARADQIDLTGGTGRWWKLTPRKWILSAMAHTTSWRLVEQSPFNPPSTP